MADRMKTWNMYYDNLLDLKEKGYIDLPSIPDDCEHNAHMFYIKCKDIDERTALLTYLKINEVGGVFHYIPLHSAPAGMKYSRFHGEDIYTTKESERLVRLPLYYQMVENDVEYIISRVKKFYEKG